MWMYGEDFVSSLERGSHLKDWLDVHMALFIYKISGL